MRFFTKLDQATTMRVFGRLYRCFFDNLQLDLDSTVMTRYGEQEGTARGYNPRKPGRHSPPPLMAFVADARMITNFWLRPDNSCSANNVRVFLDDTLDNLGRKRVALFRADSGFCEEAFLDDLDQRNLHYLIVLRLNQPLQIVWVTDLDLPTAELWRLYRGRADSENRIKELKYDFGRKSFNLKNFWATEAAMLTVIPAYNLMSLFHQGVLRNEIVSDKKGCSTCFTP